ncbi:MAG: LAGLIDADG family homing endonuclease [Candidatus Rokuibacteriota bacterium]
MHPRYVPIDPELLKRLYVDERLTAEEIAAQLGCGAITILRRLRRLGIPARPRGPRLTRPRAPAAWSAGLAWVVGLIATDGSLSIDGRHLCVTSKDQDMLESVRDCLGLENTITRASNSPNGSCYRLQWGNRVFYRWLLEIGLMPAKSLRLGPIAVPDILFRDFVRGCIDGDGSIVTYVDRYNTFKKPEYVYTRLFVSIVSASPRFLEWMRATVSRLMGLSGSLIVRRCPPHNDVWCLKYAKRESLALLRWIYYDPAVLSLRRKRAIAADFLVPRHPLPRRGPGRPVVT